MNHPHIRRFALGAVLLGAIALPARVEAYPTYSPSARAAARLKYRPPAGWIRHYLPDDRYKIAGGVWRYVSTQLDTYYHRADSPFMLSQPASIVIGFASASEAAEAGYSPGPSVGADVLPPLGEKSQNSGGGSTTVNRGKQAQRITLADGRSTVLLPPNWRRTQSGAMTLYGQSTLSDRLQPLKGRGYIQFSVLDAPPNLNPEQFLKPESFREMFNTITLNTNRANDILSKLTIAGARLGSLQGVSLTIKPGQNIQGATGRYIAAGRGRKIYSIDDEGKGVKGRDIIINSFQPG